MAAEVCALVDDFDNMLDFREALMKMLGHIIDIEAFVDGRTLFDLMAKDSKAAQRSVQFDVFELRESYRCGKLKKFRWILGMDTDSCVQTKNVLAQKTAIGKLMTNNKVMVEPVGWVSNNVKDDGRTKTAAFMVSRSYKVL